MIPASLLPRKNGLPSVIPLIDDAGGPVEAAKYLGLAAKTVSRYYRLNEAPRSVSLALFWVSRWGRGLIEVGAQNEAMHAYSLMTMHQVENRKLKEQLRKVEGMLHAQSGEASNDPLSVYGTGR